MKKLFMIVISASQIISTAAFSSAEQYEPFSISAVTGGYTFAGAQHLKTGPVYGGRTGYSLSQRLGIEALLDYADTEGTKNKSGATMYRFGADVLFNLMPKSRLSTNLAVGISGINVDATGGDKGLRPAWSYGAGLKYFLTKSFALRADVRHIMYNNDYSSHNNFEYTVGILIPFGTSKTVDRPAATSPTTTVVVAVEAPTPIPVPTPVPAPTLTPTPPTSTPTGTKVIIRILSNTTDSDGDGVRDSLDRCPNSPPGAIVDIDGCPKIPIPVKKNAAAIRFCDKPAVLSITFDSNKTDIKSGFFQELNKIGAFLKDFPNAKGTIEGHTDSDNARKNTNNLELSQLRAESVRTYLIKNFGINPKRIDAVGFGSTKPISPNTTAAGKAKNRRIETVFSCE